MRKDDDFWINRRGEIARERLFIAGAGKTAVVRVGVDHHRGMDVLGCGQFGHASMIDIGAQQHGSSRRLTNSKRTPAMAWGPTVVPLASTAPTPPNAASMSGQRTSTLSVGKPTGPPPALR
jgi:hypothetical protein